MIRGLQYGLEGYWLWPMDGQMADFDNCNENQNMKISLFI